MTPSELHILLEAANSATPNPQSPPNLLPTEEAATAMLALGAVAAGGLYTVGKIVAERLAASVSRQEENEKKREKEPEEDEKQLPIDIELIAKESNLYSSLLVPAEYATGIKLSHPGPSHSFQIWEKTTLNRIDGAKQRRLDQGEYSIPDVETWYRATIGRFQHEREGRLRKEGEEAARVWALRKIRREYEEGGMDSICAWAGRGQ